LLAFSWALPRLAWLRTLALFCTMTGAVLVGQALGQLGSHGPDSFVENRALLKEGPPQAEALPGPTRAHNHSLTGADNY
jgi:hypothetical protein